MSIIHRRAFLWTLSALLIAVAVLFGLWLRSAPVASPVAVVTPMSDAEAPAMTGPRELGELADGFLGVVLARRAADISAEVAGRLLEVRVRSGSTVVRDEVIATLDTSLLRHQLNMEYALRETARARYRSASLEAAKAERELARRQALGDLVSAEEIEGARFQAETSAASLEAADAEVTQATVRIEESEAKLARSSIRAPFAGMVSLRYFDPGAVVAPGTPVVRLLSTAEMMTRFAVLPTQASTIAVGDGVRLTLEGLDEPIEGVIDHVAPEIDAASRMIFVEARLELAPATARLISFGAVARVTVVRGAASSQAAL